MELSHFGENQKLFGIYHPPLNSDKNVGVVICNPIGQEYIRAHRCLNKLAHTLTSAGFHVFRFDYYGTGDSLGRREEGCVNEWIRNIDTAVRYLKEGLSLDFISVIGLRFGATLAAMALTNGMEVDSIVMWNPVIEGKSYLKELRKLHSEWLEGAFLNYTPNGEGGREELLGFPYCQKLIEQIEAADLYGDKVVLKKTTVIDNKKEEEIDRLIANYRKEGNFINYFHIPEHSFWMMKSDKTIKGIVPVNSINKVTESLKSFYL